MSKLCSAVNINVNLENAAFEDESELPRILRDLADKIERKVMHFGEIALRDLNGNKVGEAKFQK